MARPKKSTKTTRKQYSEEYRSEALALAAKVGVSAAAKQLGLHASQIYGWRSKARLHQDRGDAEKQLAAENARLKRQLAEQAEELAILKKGRGVLCKEPEMRYAFMQEHRQEFSVKAMVRVLNVSRSGFYDWVARGTLCSKRQQHRDQLDRLAQECFTASKKRSGAPRLTKELASRGNAYNRKTVAASMRRQGLRAKAAKKYKATTSSKHNLPVASNLLKQNFNATAANQKWVGDITYLWTEEGWLYLAVVIDLYSRLVVGWAMSERMTATLVCDALRMALWRRKIPRGVIVHSDRGSQYCSRDYQSLIKAHNLECSMSAKGNCYDNACAETFFHSLKVESIHGERFPTRLVMRETVFEYIEVDDNRTRLHSANGYLSPEAFEAQQTA
ncbi:IS3 family transposase [Microbulbifer sp. 2304DJ12-6]|uniref:IS3 family transposase n=1 Tax=Microbulbifer sp. 2304DJ12-6 TaxID=3233340 RepID=UPI0039B055B0